MKFRHLVAGMAATALLTSGVTAYAADSFSDVPPSNTFYDEIEWMSATGISTGYADGTYRPGDPVSRQAMSAFMQRLYGIQANRTGLKSTDSSSGSVTSPTAAPYDSAWVSVTDLATDVVVPPGTQAKLVANMTAQATCNGGDNQFAVFLVIAPNCQVRLSYTRISGGLSIVSQLSPDHFDVLYSDLTDAQMAGDPDLVVQSETFTVQANSGVVGAGTWRVTPEIRVQNGGSDQLVFELDAASMRVDAILQAPPG